MTILFWFLVVAASAFVGAEVIAWCGPAQRALLRRGAAKLPNEHRGRYIEEWTAELDALPNGPVTRVVFTVSLLARSRRLESELRNRTRDLADLFEEMQERGLKAVIVQRFDRGSGRFVATIVAEAPNGEQYAWYWEGRRLTRTSVPDVELGFEHLQPMGMTILRLRADSHAAGGERASVPSTVGEARLPSRVFETGT